VGRAENVREWNSGDRHQAEPAQHDRQQPAEKHQEDEATRTAHPPSTHSGRILENARSTTAHRRAGHTRHALFVAGVVLRDEDVEQRSDVDVALNG